MFRLIAALVTRQGWAVVLGWAALLGWLYVVAPSWSAVSRDDDVRFFPPEYPSVIGQGLLERGFPADTASSSLIVIAERPEGELTAPDREFLDRLERALRDLGQEKPELGIKEVVGRNRPVIGERLVQGRPEGGQVALTAVMLHGTFASKEARITVGEVLGLLDGLRPEAPKGLNLAVTGSAAVGHDSNAAANQSLHATTVATIALVVVILLVVYRSPILALIPLATIALSAWAALMLIARMALPPFDFQVINITKVFLIVVLFGAGTDYCLFLIARYREELARGRSRRDAIAEAIRQVGGALAASAGTVIIGLGMLWFSTFAKIQYTGPAIALSLLIALAAALTLAPVMLRLLGRAVFWPFRPPQHHRGTDPEDESLEETPMFGLWAAIANAVVRYPALILGASLVLLLPFAWIGAQTKTSYDILADLDPGQTSIQGSKVFRSYYPEGELGPSTILIRHPELDFTSDWGRETIRDLSQRLAQLPHVAEVRSLTRPLGKPGQFAPPDADEAEPEAATAASGGLLGQIGQFGRGAQQAITELRRQAIWSEILDHYVSTGRKTSPGREVAATDRNHITRLDVIFDISPFSEESLEALANVSATVAEVTRAGNLSGATFGLAGTTVQINDLKRVTTQDERRMYVLVTVGVYAILVLLLRRPGICLYLIATVILGYLASLGLTDLVFRWLHNGPEPWMGLDWKVGFFLFVILVAVGEDYNIFLMSRVIEEERKHGPIEGTRRAVAHTGGIISSCGVIMAGTFGAMLFGSLTALQELGFALGLGVLLDTFIVRPVLVPAFVVLWHRWRPEAELNAPGFPQDQAEPAASAS